jgi:exodeoxyribonuclease VII large subunit
MPGGSASINMSEMQTNLVEVSVSELSGAIKRQIEENFDRVRVRGELGRVSRPGSGHLYFDLKDDKAVLAAVAWKGTAQKMSVQPEQGLEVIATGKLTTFPGQSRYQLIVDSIEPAGEGALMALLEARKKQLAAEGLFDAAVKKPLPFLPEVIGVVTSPSGAVIRDILHRLADRFPRHVLVWPVRVQGETCAEEVARAIAGFNALPGDGPVPRPDVIIVARGGGSLEDLWPFNEEIVVRTVAQSDIPLISAIGHETDTTLIDYAADQRAPTPTAAAELAVPVRADLMANVNDLKTRQMRAQNRLLEQARGLPKLEDILALPRQHLDGLGQRLALGLQANVQHHRFAKERIGARLTPLALRQRAQQSRQHVYDLERRGRGQIKALFERQSVRLTAAARELTLLSHESILQRGFALVLDAAGSPVRRADAVQAGDVLTVQLARQETLQARVEGPRPPTPSKAKRKKPTTDDGEQGTLL